MAQLSDEEIVALVYSSEPRLVMSKFISIDDLRKAQIVRAYQMGLSESRKGMFTESQMEDAWCGGVSSVDRDGVQVEIFQDWLAQYKKETNNG